MASADRPIQPSLLDCAARQFVAGMLEGFDPSIGEPIAIPAPCGASSEDRCAEAMPSVSAIVRARMLTTITRCHGISERSRRLRHARAA